MRRLLLSAVLPFLGFGGAQVAQAELLAIGRVSAAGHLSHANSPIDAQIASNKESDGDYRVVLTLPGAFAGATATDFIVNATPHWGTSYDVAVLSNVGNVSGDELTVDFKVEDVEDSTALSSPLPINRAFFFQVYRIPSADTVSSNSDLVFASGTVNASGDLISGVTPEGGTLFASRPASGEYEIMIENPGQFSLDGDLDYVLALSVEGSTHQDEIIRGEVVDTGGDDEVVFGVFVDDAQSTTDDDNPTPANRGFHFIIYRVPQIGETPMVSSRLLVGMARVNGASGFLQASAAGAPDGSVIAERLGEGDYRVTIISPGRFAGKQGGQYSTLAQCYSAVHTDENAVSQASVLDDNTLIVDVATSDIENDGTSSPTPQDRNFSVLVFEAFAARQPDMRIGRKRSVPLMKGDDRYNLNGVGQRINVKTRASGKAGFFFAVENDGNVREGFVVGRRGKVRGLKPKYFRLTGGRANVTSSLKKTGYATSDVLPGERVVFKGLVKRAGNSTARRSKLRLQARLSSTGAIRDVGQVIVKSAP